MPKKRITAWILLVLAFAQTLLFAAPAFNEAAPNETAALENTEQPLDPADTSAPADTAEPDETALPHENDPAPAVIYSDGSTGEMVVRIQIRLRELGYLCYRPTGAYRAMTVKAVEAFQKRLSASGDDIGIDGKLGPQTLLRLFGFGAPRVRIPDSVHIPKGPTADRLKVTGELVGWETVKQQLRSGMTYTVMDCYTGESFALVFAGGENHAEMELWNESQKESFDSICGPAYNYLKRPVVVEINGRKIAASLQCWPHGGDTIAGNGMDGHVCVFFSGSLSHVGMLPDVEHEAQVLIAAGN